MIPFEGVSTVLSAASRSRHLVHRGDGPVYDGTGYAQISKLIHASNLAGLEELIKEVRPVVSTMEECREAPAPRLKKEISQTH